MKHLLPLVLAAQLLVAAAALAAGDCGDCHTEEGGGALKGSTVSEMCLGCHDGMRATGVASIHPVGVGYESAYSRRRAFLRPSSAPSGLGGSIERDLLVQGRVECSSCHDPHAGHGSGTVALRKPDTRSTLCLTCHDLGSAGEGGGLQFCDWSEWWLRWLLRGVGAPAAGKGGAAPSAGAEAGGGRP